MAAINFTAVYDDNVKISDAITTDHFGLNLSFAWNHIGSGWKKFDDIAKELSTDVNENSYGTQSVR